MLEIEILPCRIDTWPCTESWRYVGSRCVACGEPFESHAMRFCKGCRGISCMKCHPLNTPELRKYPVCKRCRETD